MHIVWWGLTIIFAIFSLVFFIGIFKPDIFNQKLKEGEKPWTRKKAVWSFVVCFLILAGCSNLATGHNASTNTTNNQATATVSKTEPIKETSTPKTNPQLTPDQKIDKDLENIVVTNVLDLTNPKISHESFKNNDDNGSYYADGIVSGNDQSGKKVEYDFNAYINQSASDNGDNIVQWWYENTATYKMDTGSINTSTGLVTSLNATTNELEKEQSASK